MPKIDHIRAADNIIDAQNRIRFIAAMFSLSNLSAIEFSDKMSNGLHGILMDIEDLLEDAQTALNLPPDAA